MTGSLAIALDAPLRGVRLLSPAAGAGAPAAAKVRWLVQLGAAQARREAEARTVTAIAKGLQQALSAVNAAVAQRLDEVAAIAVDLGLAVAREIVGDALDHGAIDPTPTVVHCLRDCVHGSGGADLRVRLHPEDLEPVLTRLQAMPELRGLVSDSHIVADPTVARGSVLAETDAGRLRYEPREVFERVAEAVRNAAGGGGS